MITIKTRKHNEHTHLTGSHIIDGYEIINAAPCTECIMFLRKYGITKIYHSTFNGIIKINLNQICDDDYKSTTAQLQFRNDRNEKLSKKKKNKSKNKLQKKI